MRIIVNGKEKIETRETLSYSDVIMLAYQNGSRPDRPSVTYRVKLAKDHSRQGILSYGDTVELCDGMVFNVVNTCNA